MINDWKNILACEKNSPYFKKILSFIIKSKKKGMKIYPLQQDIFNVFRYTKFNNIKIVILGQDPYHNDKQAHGLAFSVLPGTSLPPSLINIYKELADDIPNFIIPKHGYLYHWALQGVFLLNTILTVEKDKANSHAHIGWELFTDKVITMISTFLKGIIFMLWGTLAQKKINLIDTNRHFILKSSHPSPFSAYRSFIGCKHFSKANLLLKQQGKHIIDWQIPN